MDVKRTDIGIKVNMLLCYSYNIHLMPQRYVKRTEMDTSIKEGQSIALSKGWSVDRSTKG